MQYLMKNTKTLKKSTANDADDDTLWTVIHKAKYQVQIYRSYNAKIPRFFIVYISKLAFLINFHNKIQKKAVFWKLLPVTKFQLGYDNLKFWIKKRYSTPRFISIFAPIDPHTHTHPYEWLWRLKPATFKTYLFSIFATDVALIIVLSVIQNVQCLMLKNWNCFMFK